MPLSNISPRLEFTDKYDERQASAYYLKHKTGIRRRLSNRLEQRMASAALALAGYPGTVLDLPCGTGRFWSTLRKSGASNIIAADYSQAMLDLAEQANKDHDSSATALVKTSAFNIDLQDNSVDAVFCMRLLHHIVRQDDRRWILREFARVTRNHAIVSVWVDGNYQAKRRRRLETKRPPRKFQNRFVIEPYTFEAEAEESGFSIIDHVDLLPAISMWRTYVLALR